MRRFTLLLGAAVVLTCAGGCGSGGDQTSSDQSVSSDLAASPAIQAAGPSDPGTNLEQLLSRSTPELVDVSVSCPSSERLHHYPFNCRLVAKDRKRAGRVSGEVTVIGIYRPTRTYAFEVTYGPAGAPAGH